MESPRAAVGPKQSEAVRSDILRDVEVEELCAFQKRAIDTVSGELRAIDAEIAEADAAVADSQNRIHALRGLMRKRGVVVVDSEGGAVRAEFGGNQMRPHDKRGRATQRRLKPPEPSEDGGETVGNTSKGTTVIDGEAPVIACVYTNFSKRYEAPRQSFQGPAANATIFFAENTEQDVLNIVKSLEPGSYVWLVYWFDRNAGCWREKVRPPRARGGWRIGLFASRSPHRPTPVGLSLARVARVELHPNPVVEVSGVDILDETPLVGIRPYDPKTEHHPDVKSGWLDDPEKLQPLYYDEVHASRMAGTVVPHIACSVEVADGVHQKLEYLNARSTVDVISMLMSTLGRVVLDNDEVKTLDGKSERKAVPWDVTGEQVSNMYPVGAWRVWFTVDCEKNVAKIVDVTSGIRKEVVFAEGDVDREVREHRDYSVLFGQEPPL